MRSFSVRSYSSQVFVLIAISLSHQGSAQGSGVQIQVYDDANQSAESPYHLGNPSGVDRPLEGLSIQVYGQSAVGDILSDGQGLATIDLEPGSYLLLPELPEGSTATSHNSPPRLSAALEDGELNILAFGDSVGTVGAPPYHAYLRDLLAPIVTITLNNQSKGGSEAAEWVPGSALFEGRLGGAISGADVIVFTLGGNDLAHHFYDAGTDPISLIQALLQLPQLVQQVGDDLHTIAEAIHEQNPDASLVYMVYPNYASTEQWREATGAIYPLVQRGFALCFNHMRASLSELPYVTFADMLGALGWDTPLDGLLQDAWHPNQAGHALIAEEMFISLGGARVGDEPLGLERGIWLGED